MTSAERSLPAAKLVAIQAGQATGAADSDRKIDGPLDLGPKVGSAVLREPQELLDLVV